MARLEEPVAEKNPFLTGTAHAPATALSEKLGLSPGTKHAPRGLVHGAESPEEHEGSEESSEDEHEVDECVLEEMTKLESTFDEIGMKFRMIDRIGEGELRPS